MKEIPSKTIEYDKNYFRQVKGIRGGGARVKFQKFNCLDISYSPEFLVFIMGSFVFQLSTVVEI